MSGLEIAIPIVSAVAAMVSAYKDGNTILNKIQERRRRRGVSLATNNLGDAFLRGEREISDAEADIKRCFGDDFHADEKTIQAFKDITIKLQDAIIKQLSAAQENDDLNDFSSCLKEADTIRRQAVMLLYELYTKLEVQNQTRGGRSPNQEEPKRSPTSDAIQNQCDSPISRQDGFSRRQRTLSWGFWRTRGQSQSESVSPNLNGPVNTSPTAISVASPTMNGFTSPLFGSQPTPLSPAAQSSSSAAQTPPSNFISIASRTVTSALHIDELCQITTESKFRGFCMGAWRAQRWELREAMQASIRNLNRSYHCRSCKFNLPADTQSRESPCFDDRMKSSGPVYYRNLFLFKSHSPTRDNSSRYLCIFCIFAGEESQTYRTPEHLFEHVASHRGTVYRNTLLEGPIDVSPVGIAPSHLQDFDICFKFRRRHSSIQFETLPEPALNENQPVIHELSTDPT